MIAQLVLLAFASAPDASPRLLTLDEALATARAKQPQVRQSQAAVEAALARQDQARAPLLPQLGGNASYSRATANFTARPGSLPGQVSSSSGGSWDTFSYYNFGLSASQLLYDFGQARNRWRSAQAGTLAQQDNGRATLNLVLFGVRTAFFQARAAKGFVAVAADTLANQERHLKQIETFVEVGTKPEIDLAQARTDRANAQVQRITAENDYAAARALLNQAMGVEGPTDFDVADEAMGSLDGEDGATDTLLTEALDARPELAALESEVRAQQLTVRALRGAFGPSAYASTGFTDAGEHFSNLAWNWNVAVSVSVPIFQGGQTKAQVREAEANLAAIRAQSDALRQQVRLEVEQARLAVRAAKATLDASAEALVNARERLKLAEGRYETGVGNVIELGDAQVALTGAAQQKVQAEYKLAQARAGLVKALARP